MIDSKNELSYLRASLVELKPYLLSKELFWSVATPAGVRAFPKLTLGNLLLAKKKLQAISHQGTRSEYSELTHDLEEVRQKWITAWDNKARHEFGSRLRQWTHYLNDLQKNEETHAPFYPNEVRVRVLIALLENWSSADQQPALSQLDTVLRGKLKTSDFIWDSALQPKFPQDKFWFLYGLL